MPLTVEPIRAFTDNYIWLFYQPGRNSACVVDPGDAVPVEAALQEKGLSLEAILVTHHHADHIGGIERLLHSRKVPVYGPGSIAQVSHPLGDGDRLQVDNTQFEIIAVPGHTLDHIAYAAPNEPLIFCGDTLFAGGCGRLFEGTPEQMWQSLQRIRQLPAATRVYCAHEYTQANLRFAREVEPDNEELVNRALQVAAQRNADQATVPSLLDDELATNPFLRADQEGVRLAAEKHARQTLGNATEVFRVIRQWKDSF
ncbi:MAG: hydroxyacylglutathione hydrolase [Gammaproteobacteria bacterium]|nr:MAG: hydroxyacylglutathione hydrolase [Gammaproteobacteria bacterium]